jgi:starch synthase (maltosyl-transferring)
VYGIYSGYELCEHAAVPDTEEYLHAEKYEVKVRDWDAPGHIKEDIRRLNRIRRDNPALQAYRNLRFYESDDDSVLFYGKRSADGANTMLVAVNLDPFEPRTSRLHLPLAEMGIGAEQPFEVEELLTGDRHLWRGPTQTVRLDPAVEPAAIFRVHVFPHKAYGEPCY